MVMVSLHSNKTLINTVGKLKTRADSRQTHLPEPCKVSPDIQVAQEKQYAIALLVLRTEHPLQILALITFSNHFYVQLPSHVYP